MAPWMRCISKDLASLLITVSLKEKLKERGSVNLNVQSLSSSKGAIVGVLANLPKISMIIQWQRSIRRLSASLGRLQRIMTNGVVRLILLVYQT